MYSNMSKQIKYLNISYANTDDNYIHTKFVNSDLYKLIPKTQHLNKVDTERAILEAYSRAGDDGQYNIVDHLLSLYGKVYLGGTKEPEINWDEEYEKLLLARTAAKSETKKIGHYDLSVADKAYYNGQLEMLNKLSGQNRKLWGK